MKQLAGLPTPEELKNQLKLKVSKNNNIGAILRGEDSRLLLIIGPCSVHDPDAVIEYAHKLVDLAQYASGKVLIVMRVYTAKPRTDCKGFLGMLHQQNGLYNARKLHLDILEQTGLHTADELLYPALLPYFDDLLSYFAIGARSVENQEHRLVASGMSVPVGMKNPLSGDLAPMYAAVSAAKSPHGFIYRDCMVQTDGNPLAHGILRGGATPNYQLEYLAGLTEPVIVDVSHGNSGKNPLLQQEIAMDVLKSRKSQPLVRGLMVESFLKGGKGNAYGQSVTDPCLSWEDTEILIMKMLEHL
ncbi:MAG: 3-deoxy-7-phosphoheptulonate synthase [Defluviitaleaceae bacterium]|nr:3-deoxy-7-phosphoheptulonate synthase [Defluviitaleaceae bacterium]